MEEFSMDWGWGVIWGWFKRIALSVKSFLLLLYQLHLGASSIRCWRLGTAALEAESPLLPGNPSALMRTSRTFKQ